MKNPPFIPIQLDETKFLAAQLLRDAADLLIKEGWCTCSIGEMGQPKCVLGALNAVSHGHTRYVGSKPKHFSYAWDALNKSAKPYGDAVTWNNAQRNATVIIDKLRQVADEMVRG